jgi:hypothetical protein
MIRKLDLIKLLQECPGNPIIAIWDEEYGEDVVLRRLALHPGNGDPVLILSADVDKISDDITIWKD